MNIQETLEEAAERIYPLQKNSLVANNKKMLRRAAWVKGAKWQQERDKDKYSDEKIDKILQKLEEIKIMINIR